MAFKDYYKILKLESNKVSVSEIKVAYREQAKKYHPDANKGNMQYEDIFKDINEAYKVLTNEKTRRTYDFQWNRHNVAKLRTGNHSPKEILKKIFFGINYSDNVINKEVSRDFETGKDINVTIMIGLKKAFLGGKKSLKINDDVIDFDIPPKVKNGDKIRIIGKGEESKNGGKNGDLIITVFIKDSDSLQLKGDDVYTNINIPVYDAALGIDLVFKLFNEDIKIVIPECTNSGTKFVVKNKGYFKDGGKRGNLIVTINLTFSKALSDKEKKAFLKLREYDINK